MKNFKIIALIIGTLAITWVACKKSKTKVETYKCTTCNSTPEAISANDGSNKGVYKGVIIGSTGTVKFDIANNSTAVKATLVIDGQTVTLTCATSPVYGQAFTGVFTGTMNGQSVSISFNPDYAVKEKVLI